MSLISQTYKALKQVKERLSDGFSGIGLVAYDSLSFSPSNHCDLRPGINLPYHSIYDEDISRFLLDISSYRNTLHDGFHFINQDGIVTHVAQYFVPAIVETLHPHPEHGVRLYSSICGSTIPGVLFIATVCSNGDIYIFRSGKEVDLNKILKGENIWMIKYLM